jgi:hypothetical protein
MQTTDILVKTGNAEALDHTLEMLPANGRVVPGSWDKAEGTCTIRVHGNPKFMLFALRNQGYAEVVSQKTVPNEP